MRLISHIEYGLSSSCHGEDGVLPAAWWGAYWRVQPLGLRNAFARSLPLALFFAMHSWTKTVKNCTRSRRAQCPGGAGFLPRLPRLARPPVGIKRTTPQRRPEQCSTALCQASICERVVLSNVRSDGFVIQRSPLEWRFCCKATICFPPLKPSLAVPSHVESPPICTLFLEGGLPPNPATPVEAQPSHAEPNQLQGFPAYARGRRCPTGSDNMPGKL